MALCSSARENHFRLLTTLDIEIYHIELYTDGTSQIFKYHMSYDEHDELNSEYNELIVATGAIG